MAFIGKAEAEHDGFFDNRSSEYLVVVGQFLGKRRVYPRDVADNIAR